MKLSKKYNIKGRPIRLLFLSLSVLIVFALIQKLQLNLTAENIKSSIVASSNCDNAIKVRKSGGESGVGHHAINIGILNTCKTDVQLSGYPTIVLVGPDGREAGINVINTASTFFLKANPLEPIVIKPGREAYFQIEFSSVATDKKCKPISKIRIKLPGIDSSFVLNVQMKPCGEEVRVSPICSSVSSNN